VAASLSEVGGAWRQRQPPYCLSEMERTSERALGLLHYSGTFNNPPRVPAPSCDGWTGVRDMWGTAERSRVLGSLTICGLGENDDDGVAREH
jgi:hypothetical protein